MPRFAVSCSEYTVRLLSACRLFDGIAAKELPAVLEKLGAREIKRKKGEFFFREGEPAERVGILLSGAAQILRSDYYGKVHVLSDLLPGELFGEVFACANVKEYPVSVVASKESAALFMNCQQLFFASHEWDQQRMRLVQNLLFVTARKNLLLNRKIDLLSQRTTREKLMAFLLMKAKENQSERFTIPYDRQTLADYLGVERSAMCSELSHMRRDGLIEYHKNEFLLQKTIVSQKK